MYFFFEMGKSNMLWILTMTFICHISLAANEVISRRAKEIAVLDETIDSRNYDARIRPSGINGTDSPTIVYVSMYVRRLSKMDDVNGEFSVQLTFRARWVDDRLKFDDLRGHVKYLTLSDVERLWMPDIFFSNEIEAHQHNIIKPNTYIRVFRNGEVTYNAKISLRLTCSMDFKLYPFDRQICSIKLASYKWTADDLFFHWQKYDPVSITKDLYLPHFTLKKYISTECNSMASSGEYSCLKVDFILKRQFFYYLTQIYMPCCMLVIISWISFWLDQKDALARIFLSITTLFIMVTQISGLNAQMPKVSYTKAIDIWTGVCLSFIFGVLFEFAIVNYVSRSDSQPSNLRKTRLENSINADLNCQNSDNTSLAEKPDDSQKQSNSCQCGLLKFSSRSEKIDNLSRILFPLLFVFFNLLYWCTYLLAKEKEDV